MIILGEKEEKRKVRITWVCRAYQTGIADSRMSAEDNLWNLFAVTALA